MKTTAKTAASLVLLPLVLTACGSGRDPQTYDRRIQGDSSEVVVDDVTVVNLRVLPPAEGDLHPKGSDARVGLVLVNDAPTPDALTAATSDAAESVALTVDTAPVDRIDLPAQGTAAGASLVLRGLTRDLRTGQYVTLRLTFAQAGTAEKLVPVSTPEGVRERGPANPEIGEPAHGGGGEGHGEESGEAGHSEGKTEGSGH